MGLNRPSTDVGAKTCKSQSHAMHVIMLSFDRKSFRKIYSENSCVDRVRSFVKTPTHSDSVFCHSDSGFAIPKWDSAIPILDFAIPEWDFAVPILDLAIPEWDFAIAVLYFAIPESDYCKLNPPLY